MGRTLRGGGRVAAIVYTTAENNKFFSLPVSIIRRRAQLPPPLPGQPRSFSLGTPGVLEEAFRQAGFRDRAARSLGYLPLRYEWHAVVSAPGTALPPQDLASSTSDL